ncbi:MAG TPA: hypothetical protein VHG91_11930 [Longimicrobium sp.]|nr:hypothetical protein [Longimicrobium sp.]
MSARAPAPPAPGAASAEALDERLARVIEGDVFERLARGFVDARRRRGRPPETPESLREVHAGTLRLLARLLFALHLEARGLLPGHGEEGRDAGLGRLRDEAAALRDAARPLSPASFDLWEALAERFARLAAGEAALGVAPLEPLFGEDDAAGRFLAENGVADLFLVHALDRLSRDDDGAPFDYAALDPAGAGALCEGLLDRPLEADASGKPALAPAPAARPLPRWVADHAVAAALAPALDARAAAFRDALAGADALRLRMIGADAEARRAFQAEVAALETRAEDALLELRVCDPAMGSGAFLARAAEHVTDAWAALLAAHPGNPLSARLDALRGEVTAALGARGGYADPQALSDLALLRRLVVRRCLFGADARAGAVELARLTLWLAGYAPGAPLPFLDAHLRAGSALAGSSVEETRAARDSGPQAELDTSGDPFADVTAELATAAGFAFRDDATAAEAAEGARAFAATERALEPYRRLLDLWTSRAFGNPRAEELAALHGAEVVETARGRRVTFAAAHLEALARAHELAREHGFLHWDLAFPEAFADLEAGAWRADGGFDALVGAAPAGADPEALHARALGLLRPGGRMALVAPDRWMHAPGGEGLRRLLAERGETERVVGFGRAALVDGAPAALAVVRRPARGAAGEGETVVTVYPRREMDPREAAAYFASHAYAVPRARFGAAPWSLEPPDVQRLMDRLRAAGTPLRDLLGASPVPGVRAGGAEGFLVDDAARAALVARDPASAELLRPYLRAADVDRWAPAWSGTWIVAIPSSDERRWPWSGMDEGEAERAFARAYPAVHAHLKPLEDRLRTRADRGRHWWESRGGASLEDPAGARIVYAEVQPRPAFALDRVGFCAGGRTFVLPEGPAHLPAVLNAPLLWWYAWRAFPRVKDEAVSFPAIRVDALPVPPLTPELAAEAGPAAERLVELARERREVRGELLAWLAAEYGVAHSGPVLEGFAGLAADAFVDEVRRRRPKRADPLSPREVGMLRNAHADAAPRLLALDARAAGLERRLGQLVHRAYGLTPEEVELVWQTAPPRMPAGR